MIFLDFSYHCGEFTRRNVGQWCTCIKDYMLWLNQSDFSCSNKNSSKRNLPMIIWSQGHPFKCTLIGSRHYICTNPNLWLLLCVSNKHRETPDLDLPLIKQLINYQILVFCSDSAWTQPDETIWFNGLYHVRTKEISYADISSLSNCKVSEVCALKLAVSISWNSLLHHIPFHRTSCILYFIKPWWYTYNDALKYRCLSIRWRGCFIKPFSCTLIRWAINIWNP